MPKRVIVSQRMDANRIDPDPVVVAMASMAAASLVLQFVQVWKVFNPTSAKSSVGAKSTRSETLDQLQSTTEKFKEDLRQIHRIIDRGSSDSDEEFYDAEFRVARTQLNLDENSHRSFQLKLGTTLGDLGNLTIWINHVIREDPDLAQRLGARLSGGLADTAEVLNDTMARGGPIRTVVGEAKAALEALAEAIEAEFRDGQN